MRSLTLTLLMIGSLVWLSCKESAPPSKPDPDPVKVAELTHFEPLTGKKGTIITIHGKNFGNDPAKITLKINDLAGVIKTVTDSEITATVPNKCGLGKLSLTVNGKELTSQVPFRYIYSVSTRFVTGGAEGYADGAPAGVKFRSPYNIATDAKGVMFTADLGNCMVRRIEPDGTTSTVVGTPHSGFKDGKGDQALMKFPIGIDIAPDGSIYVADHENDAIRKILPDGTLTTLTGHPDKQGSTDGDLATARFKRPYGVKLDKSGILWVCDTENGLIRKVTPEGQVSTYAGSTPGYADGKLRDAKFYMPAYLNFDTAGNIYIADKHNHCIRKITADGMVTTFAGKPEKDGYLDGNANDAMFNQPSNIQIDKLGNLYVTDLWNHCIRLVYPDGFVTTLAGKGGTPGYVEGQAENSLFYHPQGSTLDKDENLFVTDSHNNRVRKLTIE